MSGRGRRGEGVGKAPLKSDIRYWLTLFSLLLHGYETEWNDLLWSEFPLSV